MNKLYKKPIDDEYIKLFNIKEDTYIQTSNLTKKTHYDIQCIIRLFDEILKDLENNYQHIISFSSHNILDNPTILSLIKVEYDLSKNAIIKVAQHMFNKFNNNEFKETLDIINKLNISNIDKMYEDAFKEFIFDISTNIAEYIGTIPFNEISQIYCEYQTIPPKIVEEVKKIIFEQ
jgi:hypothetical protein